MFYSHEILTSRQYGVATVWLVATLGSKSTLKKVSRKAILDVDVQKACKTIVTPQAPMALRLQSSLLAGVTRVYSQQCDYMLHDAEAARNSMRVLLKAIQTKTLSADTDPKTRERLVLQDDPNFLPGLDLLPLDLDLDVMDIDTPTLQDSLRTTLSPYNSQRASAAASSQIDIPGLNIPGPPSSSVGGPVGGFGGFSVRGDSSAGVRTQIGGLDDDLGLAIDDDGTLRMVDELGSQHNNSERRVDRGGRKSQASVPHRVLDIGTHEADASGLPLDDDGFMPLQDDDFVPPPENEQNRPTIAADNALPQHQTSSETAEAPLRRQSKTKIVPLDATQELGNSVLARWSTDYLEEMAKAIRQKHTKEATAVAKQNAAFWILGQGVEGPLSIFSGARLLEALTGIDPRTGAKKRPLEDAEEYTNDRQVRQRRQPPDDDVIMGFDNNDEYMPVIGDDTIEQGREAPTPLDERQGSSIMPWNQSAGSRRPTGLFSAGGGFPTSASVGGGSQQFQFGSLGHRSGRLTSASPLQGRGPVATGDIDFPASVNDDDHDIGMTGAEEFELFGAAAQIDTQTAELSQWQRAALDGESLHFLEFVQAGVEDMDKTRLQAAAGDEEDEMLAGSIEFDALLPPAQHTRVVAAQALLHLLSLVTKSMLVVTQEEAFASITLRVGAVV